MYQWLIRNSTVERFDIGNDSNTKITFKPKIITTKGSFGFGRLE
jgi:hypothetical protein